MKNTEIFSTALLLGIVLSLAAALCACTEPEPEIECGLLTVVNIPPLGQKWSYTFDRYEDEKWGGGIYFDEEIKSQLQISNWTNSNGVAYFDSEVSPFKLMVKTGEGFLKTGTYLVCLYKYTGIRHDSYYISDVTFKNGHATIDFNDMTNEATLPYSH